MLSALVFGIHLYVLLSLKTRLSNPLMLLFTSRFVCQAGLDVMVCNRGIWILL